MLITKELNSWSEFEKIVKADLLYRSQELTTGPNFYRGHPDSTWRLETTLERCFGPNHLVAVYYKDILRIQSHLESFTDRNWDLPSYDEYVDNLRNGGRIVNKRIIIYMQYLRHFGYPSPLLDWSLSPFVAAYFAFRDVSNKATSVAIYDFLASSDLLMPPTAELVGERPTIHPVSIDSQKNKRHYLQQSVYTICLRKVNHGVCYASHEDPRIFGATGEEQDLYHGETVVKYILPVSERTTALHTLGAYNINAYSLFGTEESLLETLFLQEYKDRQIQKNIWGDMLDEFGEFRPEK